MNNQKIEKAVRVGGVRRKKPIKKITMKERESVFNQKVQQTFKRRIFPIDNVTLSIFEKEDNFEFFEKSEVKVIVDEKGAGIGYILKGKKNIVDRKQIMEKNDEKLTQIEDQNKEDGKLEQIDKSEECITEEKNKDEVEVSQVDNQENKDEKIIEEIDGEETKMGMEDEKIFDNGKGEFQDTLNGERNEETNENVKTEKMSHDDILNHVD